MKRTLGEIAKFIGGKVSGDENIVITGVSGIKEAGPEDITFVANPKYFSFADKTKAAAVIVSEEFGQIAKPFIRVKNPSLAFINVVSFVCPNQSIHSKGIHPSAIVAKSAKLGKDVSLGPYVVVEEGASIGDRSIIYAGCFIGRDTSIGPEALIYPNVTIRENVALGSRIIIHSGTVIGSDGFGYVNVDGVHHKVPQVGTVVIEDDVEIGANVTIDRARFDKTFIGKGTKIDNLVQIAHNVIIGSNSLVIAQAGISGSVVIGNNVTLAGQAGLSGHLTIGDNSIVAAQAGVTKSIPANTIVSGYPAKPHDVAIRVNACVQNLPRLYETVNELKKKVDSLQSKLKENG
ncbi:MAG: UDP-3-O-(3-hydroxymyristoyl)glucosamine N-acyltransferase [Candidatus Omnitrophota bacterium]|jgi:UDP-3-O-[3-hydroxymyristoyl] glucosamine N-acyltransferase|nr:MAG: UDP-3-O-(3-hydroxymyristoyl)glucosamine N-acyltransferase [Candidatus Omnitrophota bacterium]